MIKSLFENTVQYSKLLNYKKSGFPSSQISSLVKSKPDQVRNRSLLHIKLQEPRLSQMSLSAQVLDRELRDKAHRLCCEHLGGAWNAINSNEMSFKPISGGMSNLLYCCSLPESMQSANGEPSQVLLRLYGQQSRNNDISTQVQIFKLLSAKELGPKLYGDFEGGRLEEFLPANSLTCEELTNHEISAIIARKLAAVHSLDVPIRKEKNWIFDRFWEWCSFIKENVTPPQLTDGARESTIEIANELLAIDFGKEIKFLCKLFDGNPSPIVFSHNDLHQGNILLTKPSKRRPILEKRVILIDFEYCSYNYRAFDIANHFCEWCFEYDTPEFPHFINYEDRFPSKANQREFIRHYLDQQKRIITKHRENQNVTRFRSATSSPLTSSSSLNGMTNARLRTCNGQIQESNSNGHRISNVRQHSLSNGTTKMMDVSTDNVILVTNEEVELILNEIKPFLMAPNLLWTIWCIKSAYSSNIKFGYWEHAMARWKLYSSFKRSYKREVLSPAQTNGNDNISRV